jgi:alpha-galactosidase/6-phospho-beta-glucosidase family protein
MKGKILALLQSKFAGMRKDGLNHIANVLAFQVNTEDEAKTLVDKLTAEQVTSFITDWRKEADAEISKSNQSYEVGLRKKYDFTEKKTEPEKTPALPDLGKEIDAAAIQKIITESINAATKPLLEQINTLKAGETAKTRLQTLNDKLKDCKDETLKTMILKNFARMKFETNDEFTEYLTDTEKDVKTANQNAADSSLNKQSAPWTNNNPNPGQEATDAEIKAVMEKLPI